MQQGSKKKDLFREKSLGCGQNRAALVGSLTAASLEMEKVENYSILISAQYLTPRIADAGKVHSWRPFWESQIKYITLPQTCRKGWILLHKAGQVHTIFCHVKCSHKLFNKMETQLRDNTMQCNCTLHN